MKTVKREYVLFFWLAAGTAFATAAANRLFAEGIVSFQALYRCVAGAWDAAGQAGFEPADAGGGLLGRELRIVLSRCLQTAAVFWLCRSRKNGLTIPALLFTAGFVGGTALVMFTWCRGWFGLVCFFLSGFPQEGFYLTAWGLMVIRYGMGMEVRAGRFWSAVLALFLAGLFLEIQLNPLIVTIL